MTPTSILTLNKGVTSSMKYTVEPIGFAVHAEIATKARFSKRKG